MRMQNDASSDDEVRGERRKVAPLFRAASIDVVRAADGGDAARLELTFSSERPVERWFGVEILSHDPHHVRMDWLGSGHAPFLLDHDQSAEAQIGVVERAWIGDDRRGHAIVRMASSERAQAIMQDIEDGVRTNVSVGYRVHRLELESDQDGVKVYRVTDWEPFELSLVAVPADAAVGIGRQADVAENEVIFIERREQMTKEVEPDVIEQRDVAAETTNVSVRSDVERADEVDAKLSKEAILAAERKRVDEIMALAARHNMRDLADQAIREGWSVERMRGAILDRYGDEMPTSSISGDATIGMSEREVREYSFLRAMRAAMTQDWSHAPFEREVSEQVARQLGRTTQGFYVPEDVQVGHRDITIAAPGQGASLVGTQHMSSAFIELYRNRLMVRRAGARVMSGLQGNVSIPRQAGGASANWLADEHSAALPSEASFDDITLTPKTAAAHSVISRQLLMQSSPDVEMLVREDLAAAAAAAVDLAAINGSGASGEPLGILQTTGIGLVDIAANGGAPTWQHIVQLETEVAVDNADVGQLAYMTNARVRGKLKTTPKEAGQATYIWADVQQEPGVGMVNGYRAYTTNQVPANLTKGTGTGLSAIIFGNWRDLLIGEWGALEVIVNPYSLDTTGKVRITVFKSVDVAVRHAESFAAIKDAATA